MIRLNHKFRVLPSDVVLASSKVDFVNFNRPDTDPSPLFLGMVLCSLPIELPQRWGDIRCCTAKPRCCPKTPLGGFSQSAASKRKALRVATAVALSQVTTNFPSRSPLQLLPSHSFTYPSFPILILACSPDSRPLHYA